MMPTGEVGRLLRQSFAKPKPPHKVRVTFEIDVDDEVWQMLKRRRASCEQTQPELSFGDWVKLDLTETAQAELDHWLHDYIPDNYS